MPHSSTHFNSRKLILILSLLLTWLMSSALAGPVQFSKTKIVNRDNFTKLTFGPDGHLYAATSEGEVYRYRLKSNGTVDAGEKIIAAAEVANKSAINGITFTPNATADNLDFIISFINFRPAGSEVYRFKFRAFGEANPILEKTKLIEGIGLYGNHGVNDVLFGNDGLLYINMAGQTYSGLEEKKHTASIVQVDLSHDAFDNSPINIVTLFENENDLYSSALPIRLFATGLRNPGGLHLHSNGSFYATVHDPQGNLPTLYPNGSTKDHSYKHIPDLVVKIEQGKYYGHASPYGRGENIAYGGNPTDGIDPFEMSGFPVGTQPEPNFDPSLIIKTQRNNCIGGLDEFEFNSKKYLLVTYLKLNGSTQGRVEWIPLTEDGKFETEAATKDYLKDGSGNVIQLNGTMDVLVNPVNQNIYVADFGRRDHNTASSGTGAIYLLKPLNINVAPTVAITYPTNQEELALDQNISIAANASDYDGSVLIVKFYVDGVEVGEDLNAAYSANWTPTAPGTYEITAVAEDNEGATTTSAPVTVQIDSNSVAPKINSSAITTAFVGTQYIYDVNASGNPAPVYYLSTKPNGMTINQNTGVISWSPTSAGTYNVTVDAENGVNPSVSQSFTISVSAIRNPDFPSGSVASLNDGLEYSYYEIPRIFDLPNFSQLEAVSQGNLANFSRDPRARDIDFAFDYNGFVEVPEDGIYTFSTRSNDGSHLYIGNQLVVNNGGAHAAETKSGSISLAAGKHAIRVTYYNNGGANSHVLEVSYAGPGIDGTVLIPDSALYRYSESYGLNNISQANPYLNMPKTESGIIPSTLSQTGVFADTINFVLAEGAVPFDVITPLWSDGAKKDRWFFVPAGQKIVINDPNAENWKFPAGSVLVKHFALGNERKRVETRLTVVKEDGNLYGFTYRWRDDNSDADLVTKAVTAAVEFDGTFQDWYFPSPQDCMSCHTPATNGILGPNTRQLNRDLTYLSTGKSDNQLRTLNKLNLFSHSIAEENIPSMEKMVSLSDKEASLEDKVRSYLDSNCSHCHRPGGVNGASWDGRFAIPINEKGLIDELANNNLGIDGLKLVHSGNEAQSAIFKRMNSLEPGVSMPPLAKSQVDEEAIQVVTEWINSLSREASIEITNYPVNEVTVLPSGSAVKLEVRAYDPDGITRIKFHAVNEDGTELIKGSSKEVDGFYTYTFADLADGTYTFKARLIDAGDPIDRSLYSEEVTIEIGGNTNLLSNGNFTKGLEGWSATVIQSVATLGVVDGLFIADIQQPPMKNWHINLAQNNLSLESGESYTIKLDAVATKTDGQTVIARKIAIQIKDRNTGDSILWKTFTINSDQMATYEHTFTNDKNSSGNCELKIWMGYVDTANVLYLDNLKLIATPEE